MIYRILFLEDEQNDVELMTYELSKSGLRFEFKRVASKKDFLLALEQYKPNIVLADYSLPMFNGMHAFRLFREQQRRIPFILVTGGLNEELASECLAEGVDDFVLKSNFKRLPFVIKQSCRIKEIESEKSRIEAELQKTETELESLQSKVRMDIAAEILSAREREILCLIAGGKTMKEIAAKLFLSAGTVATYRSRLLSKLNLGSNVDLTRYAMQHNLVG